MNIKELTTQAYEVKDLYDALNKLRGQRVWDSLAYTAGLVGDVGDLMKLVMAQAKLRDSAPASADIAHELVDCLWSLLILAEEQGIDLEGAFVTSMAALKQKLSKT